MDFIRRVYYERATGALILFYQTWYEGVLPGIEADFAREPELTGYAGRRDEVGLLEWREADGEIERQFEEKYCAGVRIEGDRAALMFAAYESEEEEGGTEDA